MADLLFFKNAFRYTLENEGGFVFDPADPGGATNFGITLETLSHWRGHPVSPKDVEKLTAVEALEIYYKSYWCPIGCPKLQHFAVAAALFDTGVLFGIGTAVLYAQKALRNVPGVVIDGYMGPRTVAALNAVNPGDFLRVYIFLLKCRIEDIIHHRPTSLKFRSGWEARVNRLEGLENYVLSTKI